MKNFFEPIVTFFRCLGMMSLAPLWGFVLLWVIISDLIAIK